MSRMNDHLFSLQGQASGIVATKTSSVTGLLLSVFSSMMSALGGIYSEKLLKGRASTSIHWQNIQLYIWGVFFNGAGRYLYIGCVLIFSLCMRAEGTIAVLQDNCTNGRFE